MATSGSAVPDILTINPNPKKTVNIVKICSGLLCSALVTYFILTWSMFSTVVAGAVILCTAAWVVRVIKEGDVEMHAAPGKAVVITGCDTGFGLWLAKRLDTLGCVVFAGCLMEDGPGAGQLRASGSERMNVLQMDVTSQTQVDACVAKVQNVLKKQSFSGLWGVVNNAGINFLGDIELTSMGQFQKICHVNQLGVVRVTKAFLPLIRKTQGRVVNITSVKGLLPMPFNSAYGMTKFAGEAFTHMLRQEMAPFGVKAISIQPCNFGGVTGCLEMNRIRKDFEVMWENMDEELRKTYGKDYMEFQVKAAEDAIPSASKKVYEVLDAIIEGLLAVSPKCSYLIPGGTGKYDIYKIRARYFPYLPEWVIDYDLRRDLAGSFPLPSALRNEEKKTY